MIKKKYNKKIFFWKTIIVDENLAQEQIPQQYHKKAYSSRKSKIDIEKNAFEQPTTRTKFCKCCKKTTTGSGEEISTQDEMSKKEWIFIVVLLIFFLLALTVLLIGLLYYKGYFI